MHERPTTNQDTMERKPCGEQGISKACTECQAVPINASGGSWGADGGRFYLQRPFAGVHGVTFPPWKAELGGEEDSRLLPCVPKEMGADPSTG